MTDWIVSLTDEKRRILLRMWYPDVADLLFALIDAGPDDVTWTAPACLNDRLRFEYFCQIHLDASDHGVEYGSGGSIDPAPDGKRECCQGADGLHHEDCPNDV